MFLFTELPLKKRSSRFVSILAPAGASSPSFLPSLLSLRQQRRGRRRRPRREGQPRERPQGPSQGRRKRRRDRDPRPRGSRRETRTRARRRRGACGRGRRRHRRTQEPLVEAGPVDHEPAAVAVDVPRVLLLEVVPSEEKRERRGRERERERQGEVRAKKGGREKRWRGGKTTTKRQKTHSCILTVPKVAFESIQCTTWPQGSATGVASLTSGVRAKPPARSAPSVQNGTPSLPRSPLQ